MFVALLPTVSSAQSLNKISEDGSLTQMDGSRNFNPHNNDTTSKAKVVPKGIYVWTVDRKFGDIIKTDVDTLPHLYPQHTMATGMFGQYNTIGSNFTPRLTRIFADRRQTTQFLFTDTYDQMLKQPDEWHFTNTLSPITNLSYGSCGDKTNGEDLIDARFAVNAGKKTGIGFDLDYRYARGYFQNQNNSHFGASFYVSHLGDRYQLHALFQTHHQKATENGGITNDDYITHPELFTESYSDNEIPTLLSSNWNRNDHQKLFLTHRYNVGFYRKVPMTEEEIKAKKFAEESEKEKKKGNKKEEEKPVTAGRPDNAKILDEEPPSLQRDSLIADAIRISVDSKAMADSLSAASVADSTEMYMKREFVPVTSFIHTAELIHHDRKYQAYASPDALYANTFFNTLENNRYGGDSILDVTKQLNIRNTFAVALLEGFNKYAAAGLKAFVTHELRRFEMPDKDDNDSLFTRRWTEHNVSVGGQLTKTQGTALHYSLTAEAWLAGEDAGQLRLDANGDLNLRLLGDTVRLDVLAGMKRMNPVFLQRRYHSKHLWWDNDFSKETHTHLEGSLKYPKTNTLLRVAVDEIENYTYLGMSYAINEDKRSSLTANYRQHDKSLSVVMAQIDQKLQLGPLHWDNLLTWQTTTDKDVLPLPTFNVFTNLYLHFTVAGVLNMDLGASGTWFSKYYAPDFLPLLNQYAVQENKETRMELGNFPFVDVYANLHLKHARFFIMFTNVLGNSLNRKAFLTPHYPLNHSVMHLGVSWNFFN